MQNDRIHSEIFLYCQTKQCVFLGIYGSLVKSKTPDFDYILLIDTEGLMSVEKRDPEYDRRLVLFCLAVSHLVIVNTVSGLTSDLETMLHICGDSLKYLGVNKVNGPTVHVVLNQKSDPNLTNHEKAIEAIESALKESHVDEWIKINRETFHTLPSAFDQKRIGEAIAVDTNPTFLENTQDLCGKFVATAKSRYDENSQSFSDLPRWIKSAKDVFNILQQFPDLTLFKDVFEREQNKRLQEWTRAALTSSFTSSYSRQLQAMVDKRSEVDIKNFYRLTFSQHLQKFEDELENQLKVTNASETVRKRNRRFLISQVDGNCDAWCSLALKKNERVKMATLVKDGAAFLRTLIDNATAEGTLDKDKATKKFDIMWGKEMAEIAKGFNNDAQLNKALEFVYKNYHICEIDNLPDFAHIVQYLSFIISLKARSSTEILNEFAKFFQTASFKSSPIHVHRFKIDSLTQYSFRTIEELQFLCKPTLENVFQHHKSQNQWRLDKMVKFVTGVFPSSNTAIQFSEEVWKPELHNKLREALVEKFSKTHQPSVAHSTKTISSTSQSELGVWNEVLCINVCFDRLIEAVSKTVLLKDGTQRSIDIDLVRQCVIEIDFLAKAINHELNIFKLSISKHFHSILHTCVVLILTKFVYDDELNHFNQVLAPVLANKEDLLEYFLRMVVPERTSDELFASGIVNGLLKSLEDLLNQEAIEIIHQQLEHDELTLSRVSLLTQLESKARSASTEWLVDFIMKPAMMLEAEFQCQWEKSEQEINRQIRTKKEHWKGVLIEFFDLLQSMRNSLNTKHAHRSTYISDIFEASNGTANENLTNMGKCAAELLYCHFTKQGIPENFTISRTRKKNSYVLSLDGRGTFESLRQPSNDLSTAIKAMKDKFDIISISNLIVFFDHALSLNREAKKQTEEQLGTDTSKSRSSKTTYQQDKEIEKRFDKFPSTFVDIDTTSKPRQKFKSCGCGKKCPCCNRLCDFDHTLNVSAVTNTENLHRCARGHQLRAMGGYRREFDNEASLLYCEQVADDEWIIVGTQRMRWAAFKEKHSDWEWPSAPDKSKTRQPPPHNSDLFGFIWIHAGEELCKRFNNGMIYKVHQSELPIAKPNHYILVLDHSTSMNVQNKWKELLKAVAEFIRVRIDKNRSDLLTTIVFAGRTATPHLLYNLETISITENTHTLTCSDKMNSKCVCQIIDKIDKTDVGRGTSSVKAFQSVIETLNHTRTNAIAINYPVTIIFMTDGEPTDDPKQELKTLSTTYQTTISRFWTMGLGLFNKKVLQHVNTTMKGEILDICNAEDLIQAYAEIAYTT